MNPTVRMQMFFQPEWTHFGTPYTSGVFQDCLKVANKMASTRYSSSNSTTGGVISGGVYTSTASVDDKAFAYCDSTPKEPSLSPPVSSGVAKLSNWSSPAQPALAIQPQKFTSERRASTPRSTSSGVSSPRSSTATSNISNTSMSTSSFGFGSGGGSGALATTGARNAALQPQQQQQHPQHLNGPASQSAAPTIEGLEKNITGLFALYDQYTALMHHYSSAQQTLSANYESGHHKITSTGEEIISIVNNYAHMRRKELDNWHTQHTSVLENCNKEANMRRDRIKTMLEQLQHAKRYYDAQQPEQAEQDVRAKQCLHSAEEMKLAQQQYVAQQQPHINSLPLRYRLNFVADVTGFASNVGKYVGYVVDQFTVHQQQQQQQQQQKQEHNQSTDGVKNEGGFSASGSSGVASHIGSSSSSGCNSNSSDGNSGHASPTLAQSNGTAGAAASAAAGIGPQRGETDAAGDKRLFTATGAPTAATPGSSKFSTSSQFQLHAQDNELAQLLPGCLISSSDTSNAVVMGGTPVNTNNNSHLIMPASSICMHNGEPSPSSSSNWAETANENAERMALGSRKYVASSTSASQQQLLRSTSMQQAASAQLLTPPNSHVASTSCLLDASMVMQPHSRDDMSLAQQQQQASRNNVGSKFGFSSNLNNSMTQHAHHHHTGFGETWLQLPASSSSMCGSAAGGGFESSNADSLVGGGGSGFGSTSTLSYSNNMCDLSSADSRATGTVPPTPVSASTSSSLVQQQRNGASVKRHKIRFSFKIGSDKPSVENGKFSEPSGVAVTPNGELIVADTNNHRIQVFNSDGTYKLGFGEAGRRNGQLLYPNRVAFCSFTNRIIITERAPTHQVQAFSESGQFIEKFGADFLEHPRGVTVDHRGQIIIVECRIMRVVIFDRSGSFIKSFKCENLEFPNGVAVDKREQIFISDNRAHCVRVFNYAGQYVRDIGGDNLTNYPIGVCVTPSGNVLVADNHNNFNITLFTPEGKLLEYYESSVKHAQCLDIALIDEGVVALASKDFKVYVYPYGSGIIHRQIPMSSSSSMGGDNNVLLLENDNDPSLSFRGGQQQQQQQLHLHQSSSSASICGIDRSAPAASRFQLQQRMNTPSNVSRREQYYDAFHQQQQQNVSTAADDNVFKYSHQQQQQLATPMFNNNNNNSSTSSAGQHTAFDFNAASFEAGNHNSSGYSDTFVSAGGHQHQQLAGNTSSFDSMQYKQNNNGGHTATSYSYGDNNIEDVFSPAAMQPTTPQQQQQHYHAQLHTSSNFDHSGQQQMPGSGAGGDAGQLFYNNNAKLDSFRQQQPLQNNSSSSTYGADPYGSFGGNESRNILFKHQQILSNNNVRNSGSALSIQQQSGNCYANAFVAPTRSVQPMMSAGCWANTADYGSANDDDLDVAHLTSLGQKALACDDDGHYDYADNKLLPTGTIKKSGIFDD